MAPLTAQHAWPERAHKRAGIASHRIVARLSPHTSLAAPPPPALEYPSRATSRGRVPRNAFAHARATLHNPQQPPRSDEPAERGDEGAHLEEGEGAVDGPAFGFRAGGGGEGAVRVSL